MSLNAHAPGFVTGEKYDCTIQYNNRSVQEKLSKEQLIKALMTKHYLQLYQAKSMIEKTRHTKLKFNAEDVFTEKELTLRTLKLSEPFWQERVGRVATVFDPIEARLAFLSRIVGS